MWLIEERKREQKNGSKRQQTLIDIIVDDNEACHIVFISFRDDNCHGLIIYFI